MPTTQKSHSEQVAGEQLAVTIVAVTVISAIAVLVYAQAAQGTCAWPVVEKALADKQAGSCSEFWLFRYQTLIAGLIALFAALITLQIGRRQLRVAAHDRLLQRRAAILDDYNARTIAFASASYALQWIDKMPPLFVGSPYRADQYAIPILAARELQIEILKRLPLLLLAQFDNFIM